MGRIAQALKKAQQDREEKLQLGLSQTSGSRETGVLDVDQPQRASADSPVLQDRQTKGGTSVPREADSGRMCQPPLPPWDVHPTLVAVRDRSSSATEQYRAVRTWLLRRQTTGSRQCLAITSSSPSEGKTVTTANLAAVTAELRHLNVLAIDTDFRQGNLARLFKLPNTPGLADVLGGRATIEDAIAGTPLGNLFVLPAGTCHDLNPAELINSTAAARVFEEIRERYDFVLVDTPPVQWLSDVGVVGALCSGIIMVVRMNKTPANVVRQSVHWLQSNNLNLLGCIATACSPDAARSGYRERRAEE